MKNIIFIFCLFLLALSCGKQKIDIEHMTFGPEDTWLVDQNPTQTRDSIIIYSLSDTITPSGDSMYVISTKSDKRTIDNIIERNKNGQNPVKFIMLGETYKLQKKTAFKIFVYDTLGIQFGKLMDKELNPGEYKASFSIYSVLPGGRYYLEIIFDDKKIYKRITIG